MVNQARGGSLDAQAALTGLVLVIAWGGLHLALRRLVPRAVPYLLPLAALICAVGLVEIYRLDFHQATLQRWWLLVASGLALLVSLGLRSNGTAVLRRYRYLFLTAALILLAAPLLPSTLPLRGVELNGSRLWLRLHLFGRDLVQFQPGEIAKLLLVIFLAGYLSDRQPELLSSAKSWGRLRLPQPRQLLPVALAWLASMGVMVYQRDLGASLLLFTVFLLLLYVASGRAAHLALGGLLFMGGTLAAYQMFGHAAARIDAWLDPWSDFEGSGYQLAQSLFALGSGSLSGSGLGLGRPDLIPVASTDFIFSAVAEEIGLAGAIGIVVSYALLVAAGIGIALRARDPFRKLLATGLSLVIGVQSLLILGGVTRLLPVTGISLPWMSYGGSALVANMVLLVLLARLSHEEAR